MYTLRLQECHKDICGPFYPWPCHKEICGALLPMSFITRNLWTFIIHELAIKKSVDLYYSRAWYKEIWTFITHKLVTKNSINLIFLWVCRREFYKPHFPPWACHKEFYKPHFPLELVTKKSMNLHSPWACHKKIYEPYIPHELVTKKYMNLHSSWVCHKEIWNPYESTIPKSLPWNILWLYTYFQPRYRESCAPRSLPDHTMRKFIDFPTPWVSHWKM